MLEQLCRFKKKRVQKSTPYAIIKFSDQQGEFELFLFSDILINNRNKLKKESESFILTLYKDSTSEDNIKKRVNVKKISSLDEIIKKPFSKVTIELKENYNIDEVKQILSKNGETSVNFILINKNKKKLVIVSKITENLTLKILKH